MKARGFTLIELILVIILLGIVATATTGYLSLGAQMYSDITAREQLLAQSRFAIERLSRELRGAAPNSVRISRDETSNLYQCLEYTPFVFSGLYTDAGFDAVAKSTVDVVSSQDLNTVDFNAARRLVIYPRSSNDIYTASSMAKSELASAPFVDVSQPDANVNTAQVSLSGQHVFPRRSPEQRVYILGLPVSYCLVNKKLFRYSGYGYSDVQPTTADFASSGISGVLMAEGIVNDVGEAVFTYHSPSLIQNAVINVLLHFEVMDQSDTFFNHEVHLANVP